MCDTSQGGSGGGDSGGEGGPLWQKLLIGAGKGAARGYAQTQQPAGSQPLSPQSGFLSMNQNDPLSQMLKKRRTATAASSPVGQPNSTQAPQGSSTNDDMPNQMPNFGTRPQSGGFGDEDFLRRYFSGGMSGSQGFNA